MLMRIGALNVPVRRAIKFNLKALFANGEQGFWNDPQDLSAMFQDSADTTPAVLGQPVGKILDKSGNENHATQVTTSKKPILKRQPTSGIRNVVGDSEDNTTLLWTKSRVTVNTASITETTSFGVHTLSPTTTIPNLLVGDTCTVSCDVRQISGSRRALLYLAGSFVGRFANFNFDTKNIATSAGVSAGYIDLGGGVYKLWLTSQSMNDGSGLAGIRITDNDTAAFREYTGDGISTIGVTNFQFEKGALTDYQKAIGGYDVYESGYNQVYWLDYDGVDDALVSTNPDLGANATRAMATIGGAVIEQGLTLGANQTLNTDSLGLILINRALTADELTAITSFYNEMVA
ncbi:hypothetical protein [Nitrosomonas sp. Nm132]|uniref:phage head spike fiber domain-containing protein n=1 Tax=Nitrosomonas sp. Nm132 TaxID=1881053 RepID=UPI00088B2CA0|nr:hypothetical protein [Nitrosomonas sp. Nm132]SDH27167.1 hypothetical protein SAMN05428952_100972 [Nitrosomonas sp. Nm132]